MKRLTQFFRRLQRGQSLSEMALFLPILVLLMVGVVEAGHIMRIQNLVSTAARSGARFGANGGEDAGILNVTLNTVTQTLDLNEDEWDIWTIRGTVDENYIVQPDDFTFAHVYGSQLTKLFTTTNTITFTNELRLQIQEQLRLDESGNSGADSRGLNFVGVYALFNLRSLLGLDVVESLAGFETLKGMSVMRRVALGSGSDQSGGCKGVFPIILEEGIRTVHRDEYPAADEFLYPPLPPTWDQLSGQPPYPDTKPLLEGKEGYVFKFEEGLFVPQSFDWLKWNPNLTGQGDGASILGTSLTWPGNSSDYTLRPGDSPPGAFRGFVDVLDPTDTLLHTDNRIAISPEGFGSVTSQLQDHVDTGRALRMVLWDVESNDGDSWYRASGFAIFRILGYGSNWLLLELVRLDQSCGQVVNN